MVVVGLGASGIAAAKLCQRKGAARVVLNDRREAADLDGAEGGLQESPLD